MARLGFICPPFSGHLGPMLTLAGKLAGRGHVVTFVGVRDMEPAVRRAGLGFATVGRLTHPPGVVAELSTRMGAVRGLGGLGPVIADMARMTDMLAGELPATLAAIEADCVVCDQLEAAGGIVARGLGLPHVSIANALPIDRGGDAPPFFTTWAPARSRWQRQRARGAYRVADWMMRTYGGVVARHARAFGLAHLRTCADCVSEVANVAQILPELNSGIDCPNREDVGPFREAHAAPTSRAGGAAAKIYASLGTLFGGRIDVFEALAAAVEEIGADLVIAHGGRLDKGAIARLERRGARVVPWVDQARMLSTAQVCVTHAGMNTALDAAAAGVPMVAVPFAFDQPGIATRIADAGIGIVAKPGWGLRRRLRAAIERALDDGEMRARSQALAARLGTIDGATRAAAIIEGVVGCVPARNSDCGANRNGAQAQP